MSDWYKEYEAIHKMAKDNLLGDEQYNLVHNLLERMYQAGKQSQISTMRIQLGMGVKGVDF